MSIVSKLKEATIPSIYSGIASTAIYYTFIDNDMSAQIPFLNTSIPTWAGIAGTSFIGSEIGHLLDEFVIEKIPVLKDNSILENNVAPALLAGLGTYGTMMLTISKDTSLSQALMVGAGGSLIGNGLYSRMKY